MTTRTLALALITCACVATDLVAQPIVAPASSATAVRASVGIDLSNLATTTQLSNYATTSQLSTLQNSVTNVDQRVTNVNDKVTTIQSSPQSLAWTRYFAGQTRRVDTYCCNTYVSIESDGKLSLTYNLPSQGISNAFLGYSYVGYGEAGFIPNTYATWAAQLFYVYTQSDGVIVYPRSYGPNGVPTDWTFRLTSPDIDQCTTCGGGADF